LYLIFNCTYFLISAALVFRSSIALALIKKLVISRSVRHLGRKRGGSPVLRGAESLLLLETSSGAILEEREETTLSSGVQNLSLS
jgi:hypothetical protein